MINRPLTGLLAALALLAATTLSSTAFAFCYQPQEPYCINSPGTFQDNWAFQSCKSEVERYLNSLDDYVRCVSNEAQQSASTIVDRFNCRAAGNSYC